MTTPGIISRIISMVSGSDISIGEVRFLCHSKVENGKAAFMSLVVCTHA
jgi:hypothetical protein